MDRFKLVSKFKPCGDQPAAIKKLIAGINAGKQNQVLLGVTGSGKTFTVANAIAKVNRPTLVISHNKTLAAQLYAVSWDTFDLLHPVIFLKQRLSFSENQPPEVSPFSR